jgi:hypothetical protein
MVKSHRLARIVAALALPLTIASCGDPQHDDAVTALGPEDPSVPRGPLHRPGQPCLTCHGSLGPAQAQFSLGGTIYATRGSTVPAVGALVQTEDIAGRYWTVETNAVGNFFVAAEHFIPQYPIKLNLFTADMVAAQQMLTYSARQGSCAACHAANLGPYSPGPVYLALAPAGGDSDAGGSP